MDEQTFKKLQRIYDQADTFGRELMKKEFPELEESEDERIRKAIIEFFQLQEDNTTYSFIPKKDILAWLEKQGEINHNELPKGEDYGIDSLYHALQILQATLGEVAGYQSDDGILEHKCAISVVKKLYTQIRWREDDELNMTKIIACLRGQIALDLPMMTDWIKSIKQRLTIQLEE